MIFRAAFIVPHDALEDIEAVHRLDIQTGLFPHFSAHSVLDHLAGFEKASRQRPEAFQRLTGPLDKQDRVAVEN
jgi:hypothetical protein